MVVSKVALLVIDVQQPWQHRQYWSNEELPVVLERL